MSEDILVATEDGDRHRHPQPAVPAQRRQLRRLAGAEARVRGARQRGRCQSRRHNGCGRPGLFRRGRHQGLRPAPLQLGGGEDLRRGVRRRHGRPRGGVEADHLPHKGLLRRRRVRALHRRRPAYQRGQRQVRRPSRKARNTRRIPGDAAPGEPRGARQHLVHPHERAAHRARRGAAHRARERRAAAGRIDELRLRARTGDGVPGAPVAEPPQAHSTVGAAKPPPSKASLRRRRTCPSRTSTARTSTRAGGPS